MGVNVTPVDFPITITVGESRNSTKWESTTILWTEFVERLRRPIRTSETLDEYKKMDKRSQDELKDVGGFVGGELAGERRKKKNVTRRNLVTLDLDNIPAGALDVIFDRLNALGSTYVAYSTRKHEPDRPRLRIVIPLARPAIPDEYEPIARKIAEKIGIEYCDPTTFEVHRLMYWPSCSADSEYLFVYEPGQPLDPNAILSLYTDWRNVAEWPQVPGAEKLPRQLAKKQGDPTEKDGLVGAFCRVYDIHAAIEKFIPEAYEPADEAEPPTRYTYTKGSTTGGAVVYDDGKFLYSHHATDPCSGRLVNAFDLVRLHLFGHLDDEAKPGTPTAKLPSYKEMLELAGSDEAVSRLVTEEKLKELQAASGSGSAVDTSWLHKLKINPKTKLPLNTIENILIIIENDQRLKGRIAYDEFFSRIVVFGPLPWDDRLKQGERREWTDVDDAGMRHFLETNYGIQGERRILDAIALCADRNRIDEIREYLTSLRWDGKRRLDTLLVDYLGAEDTRYTRAVTRKAFVAAVARAMQPGCKFDQMLILSGPQGIGKSTLLRTLGKSWFSDSLHTFEGREAAELIQGTWIVEVGELAGMTRSEVNAVKQFLSKTEDTYRAPYARRAQTRKRRCVFFGTTNNDEFLRDQTGNRRFWPVDVGLHKPTKDVFSELAHEVDQIWAEAFAYWQTGEPLHLTGEEAEEAKRQQEAHRETDPREGVIVEFLNRPVPDDWQKWDLQKRRLFWAGGVALDGVELVPRDRICAAEIWVECFGGDLKSMKRSDVVSINAVLDRLPGWRKARTTVRIGPYGNVRGYIREGDTG